VFKRIEDPHILNNAKSIFNALADISENAKQQSLAFSHCFNDVLDSLHGIFSSYSSSAAKEDYVKFLEFKTFSMEKMDSVHESIKKMANDLADKIKDSWDTGDNVNT
jgi:hypothetical protein